jgi:hypothetical protein
VFEGSRTVQPNGDLVIRIWVLGREEPEVQFRGLIGGAADGQKTSVRLANIEVNIWNRSRCSVNGECWKVLADVVEEGVSNTPLDASVVMI